MLSIAQNKSTTKLPLMAALAITINLVPMTSIFDESEDLIEELMELIDEPLFEDSSRVRISEVACSLSLEHWTASISHGGSSIPV